MRSQKKPCQPKTAKRIFGGPGSHGPSGQAKERTRILPVRRGSFCPARRAVCPGWLFLRGLPLLCWLLCPVPRRFFCKRCIRAGILWHRLSCLSALCRGHRFFFSAFSREAHGGISPFSAVFRRFVPGLRAAFLPPLRRLLRLFVWPALPLPAVRFVCAVPSCFGCLFACSTLFARAFFSYLSPFPVWLLPLKSLFICRSGRDGNFLACPLPWLCFLPADLVICCFFAGFCAHCLFACSALFMRVFSLLFFCPFLPNFFLSNLFSFVAQAATGISLLVPSRGFVPGLRAAFLPPLRRLLRLFVWPALPLPAMRFVCAVPSCFGCLFACSALFMRVFSLLFFALSCLTSSSQISFHLSLRPRRASTFFRKESRQRFAKGLRPFEPHSCALRPFFPSSALLAGLRGLSAANRRLAGKRLKSQGAELSFSSVSVQRGTPVPCG